MRNDSKLPLVVWCYETSLSLKDQGGWFLKQNAMETLEGPYVHLDQFLGKVEKRMKERDRCDDCEYCWKETARELAYELNKTKATS